MKQSKEFDYLSDSQLVSLYRNRGDAVIVGVLFKRYTAFVFAICNRYLRNSERSKDAVMEIFEKLFADLKQHNISNFKPWLYSVARNHCLQQLRGSKIFVPYEGGNPKLLGAFMENSMENHLGDETLWEHKLSNLEAELGTLSYEQRTCVELFYLKEKSYKEIAEETGFSTNQVKSYIQNGKRNLKIGLTRYEEE